MAGEGLRLMDVTALSAAAIGAIVGISGAYVALRKDSREGRMLAMVEARDTIDLLREQTNILKAHGESREDEWRELERGWRRREEAFEKRIAGLEHDYRALVLTVTTMGLCANAATCANYNPGDRRSRHFARPVDLETQVPEEGIEG
jgi:hypothetical protein